MKPHVPAALGLGLMTALSLSAAPAHAAPNFTASYGCRTATFTNHTSSTAMVNYGTAASDDVKSVRVPSGASRTVQVDSGSSRSFGWTASTTGGKQIAIQDFPGVNLNKYCASTGSGKDSSGGLAKTGV